MNFSDKVYSYTEFYREIVYDRHIIEMDIERNYQYRICKKLNYDEYSALIKELKMFDFNESLISNIGGPQMNLYIIRFRNKNNLLKFKLKSSII